MSVPKATKALTLTSYQSPLKLDLPTVPVLDPSERGTATVRILSAGVSPTTPIMLSGKTPFVQIPLPFVAGPHAVGRVLATGPDATLLEPGDLVLIESFVRSRDDPRTTQVLMGLTAGPMESQKKLMNAWGHGVYRTVATVPLENTHRLDEAALCGTQTSNPGSLRMRSLGCSHADLVTALPRFLVAYGGLRALRLLAGQTVIVAPATGHYSGAIVELAAAQGARVIALGRSADKLKRLAGTVSATYPSSPPVETVVVGDTSDDPASVADAESAIRALLPRGSPGADSFIDITPFTPAQPAHVNAAIKSLRPGGRVCLMGAVGSEFRIDYMTLMMRNLTVVGRWMYSHAEAGELLRMVESGVVKIGPSAGHEVVGKYALEEWETAMADVLGTGDWGKGIVFEPKGDE